MLKLFTNYFLISFVHLQKKRGKGKKRADREKWLLPHKDFDYANNTIPVKSMNSEYVFKLAMASMHLLHVLLTCRPNPVKK